MRGLIAGIGGALLAAVLIVAPGTTSPPPAGAALPKPSAPTGDTPDACVECDDSITCSALSSGSGAVTCDFSQGHCIETGYCWVSPNYPTGILIQ